MSACVAKEEGGRTDSVGAVNGIVNGDVDGLVRGERGEGYICFPDATNPRTDFDILNRKIKDALTDEEKLKCRELKKYVVNKEGAWVLDDSLLDFIGGLLHHRSLNVEIRVRVLRLLSAGALRDTFPTLLQLDSQRRHLMNYANEFETLSVEEQKALCLFFCNLFSSNRGADWLLYSSKWKPEEACGAVEDDAEDLASSDELVSNCQITSKVASFSVVSYTPSLQEWGSALIHNIAAREAKVLSIPRDKYNADDLSTLDLEYGGVSDDHLRGQVRESIDGGADGNYYVTSRSFDRVAIECSIAILKYLKRIKSPKEEIVYRCLKSLLKFSSIVRSDVKALIPKVDVDVYQFRDFSARITTVTQELETHLEKPSSKDLTMPKNL